MDDTKFLTPLEYDSLLAELSAEREPESHCSLLNSVAEFTNLTHTFTEQDVNRRCQTEFAPLYHELGMSLQSALGFLQITSTGDRNFVVEISSGEHGSIKDNPDMLRHLQLISPTFHKAYTGIANAVQEKSLQQLIGRTYQIYRRCFKPGEQWFEKMDTPVHHHKDEHFIVSGKPKLRDLPEYVLNKKEGKRTCKKTPYSLADMTGTFFLCCSHGYFLMSLLMQVIINQLMTLTHLLLLTLSSRIDGMINC
jgi:mannose-6-phosphate isomerase-like protein (cupin superfamily)